MANDSCKDQRCRAEGEVAVPDLIDHRWECGAALRDRRESDTGGFCRPRHPHAVMRAVPSATGRQICVGAGREGKQRRDQRKAEEEKQREAEDASHNHIVASFATRFVTDIFFGQEFSLGAAGILTGAELGGLRRWTYLDAGLAAAPCTMRSLSTLKAPGAELACIPAMAESVSLLTTP